MTPRLRSLGLTVLLLLASGSASAAQDRLGVPGPIELDTTRFELAFAVEPQPGYLKQEYLPVGQMLERYEAMLLVEFLEGVSDPADLVRPQVQMLEQRRASDPIANYQVLLEQDGDGIILDFLLSGETPDGTRIAEWNAYRYVAGENEDGQAGGWLVGISRRAYGDDITPFLTRLSEGRDADVAALAALEVPPDTPD